MIQLYAFMKTMRFRSPQGLLLELAVLIRARPGLSRSDKRRVRSMLTSWAEIRVPRAHVYAQKSNEDRLHEFCLDSAP